jgi:predicted acetyltransferase
VERYSPTSGLQVEVVPASSDQSVIVANLFELYAHDFSAFHEMDIGDDGRFGFAELSVFWSEPNRHAFLLRYSRRLAGFALVKKGSEITKRETVWDMAQFFVLRRYRRYGVGTEAARQIWSRFPGEWEVRVMERNKVAYRFWGHAIKTAFGEAISPVRVEIARRNWYVFSFDSALPR